MNLECPNCQEKGLRDAAKFCDKCGYDLTAGSNTILLTPPSAAGATIMAASSITEDDGATIALSELETLPQAQTTRPASASTPAKPDGATLTLPSDELPVDDGATSAMPEAGLFSRPQPAEDEGLTRAMPETELAVDDGATRLMPADKPSEDDGATRLVAETGTGEDDGATRVMAQTGGAEDDGATRAIPASESSPAVPEKTTVIADLKVGQVLQQRYRLDKILGQGGFGAVYLAQDVKLKRVCVVKQMLVPRAASTKDIDLHRANFEREAGLLVQLNHPGHPNIPEIYDYFSDAGGNYLVMKYIEGRSLKDILDQGDGKIPWREAARYAVGVCDALNYMHTLGNEPVMHRDIKPANILLGNDGRVWLVDFGLAKANPVQVEGGGDLAVTQAAGSVGYTPFEQWLGEAAPASDIYALGATLHHLVTGLNPLAAFNGEFHIQKLQELHGRFTSLRKIDRGLPKELDGIAARAVATAPDQRPTALQLKQQLEAMISGRQDAGLFTFKSGEAAKTTGQLVGLCEKYHREAEGYLYNGDFERWFLIINRHDLAEAAVQAVKRGKNQKDGLEKFLKLIMPNLFLRRLGKAGWQVTRGTAQVILIVAMVLLLVGLGGSYLARWFIQQSISGYDWNFSALDLNKENRFTEQFLTEKFKTATASYLNDLAVEVRSPDRLDIWASWVGMPLTLALYPPLKGKTPYFYVNQINHHPPVLNCRKYFGGS